MNDNDQYGAQLEELAEELDEDLESALESIKRKVKPGEYQVNSEWIVSVLCLWCCVCTV